MASPRHGPDLRLLAGGVLAGAAGTTAMTVTGRAHRLVLARHRGIDQSDIPEIVDYDDSDHVVVAATAITRHLGWDPRTPAQRRALFLLTHWGYGSAVGAAHAGLRRGLGEPTAAAMFFTACQVMALGLFPVLGDTPVPWRWERRLLVTSFAQHVVYALGVAAADAALARRVR